MSLQNIGIFLYLPLQKIDFFVTLTSVSFDINPQHIFLLALVIIALTMLRLMVQRMKKNLEKEQERKAIVKTAQEVARKQHFETVIPKSKVTPSKTRPPMVDPFGLPFSGNIQGIAAKWEAEIHQIGRQIVGQIDCKMAALQAITLDANRTANRLEILVEHLEEIARKQIERNAQADAATVLSTVIPATESVSEVAPLSDVLKELTDNLEGIRKTLKQSTTFGETPELISILRQTEPKEEPANLRGEVEMLSNYGLEPQDIAQRLNISLGEVDLMLQVQQSRFDQIM